MVQPADASVLPGDDAQTVVEVIGWSVQQQRTFLAALARADSLSEAAKSAGVTIDDALQLRSQNADFARGWVTATERAVDLLEATVLHHAVHGVPRDIVRGKTQFRVTEFSQTLMSFVLRSFRPGKYAQSRSKNLPEVTQTMTRRDMIARLKTISRRAATEGLDAPVTSNRDAA